MTKHFDSVIEQTVVNSMLQQLQANGYHVTLQPEPETLPFDLGGYQPDLIAINDDGGIILEINARHSGISVDKLQELAEKIAQHKGWRFMLVTDEDVANNFEYSTNDNLPSWLALQTKLDTIKNLIQDNMLLEPGLLYLWSLFESMLRKRAIAQFIPVDRFPADKLIKHMYSSGELSMQEFDMLMILSEKTNRIAHGLTTLLSQQEFEQPLMTAYALIKKWGAS